MEPHIHIHWTAPEPSGRTIWTEGLQEHGIPELLGPIDWVPDDDRDDYAEHVFRVVASNLLNHYVEARPGEVTRCAWSPIQLQAPDWENAPSPDQWLVLAEAFSPFGDQSQGFTLGIHHAVTILVAQREAIHRNAIHGPFNYPNANMKVVVCRRIPHSTAPRTNWCARRMRAADDTDSGWAVGCGEDDHNHDEVASWGVGHLHHLVADYPFLLLYLPMPEGTAIDVSEEGVMLFRPDEEEGHLDPGNPLAWRP
jgi:hypothetical protein